MAVDGKRYSTDVLDYDRIIALVKSFYRGGNHEMSPAESRYSFCNLKKCTKYI